MIAGYMETPMREREALLETADVKARLEKLLTKLTEELEIAELEKKLSQKVHKNIEKNQKEYYLREQLKVINKELGDDEDTQAEAERYRKRIADRPLPPEVAEILKKEVDRLAKMPPAMAKAQSSATTWIRASICPGASIRTITMTFPWRKRSWTRTTTA